MTLWALEWLRVQRTRRLLTIVAVYAFFGLTGPLTARYLGTILDAVGTEGVQVTFPKPTPADGIAQFIGNASQICLLVVVLVAASALAFDARREAAVFLRTRVRSVREIILPAYAVSTGVAVLGLLVGTGCAWYETVVLIGAPDTGAMVAGTAYGVMFLAFAVALVALAAAVVRSVLAAAGITLVVLLLTGVVGGLSGTSRWLPTSLLTALGDLVRGRHAGDFLPGLCVTVALTGVVLAGAIVLGDRREL